MDKLVIEISKDDLTSYIDDSEVKSIIQEEIKRRVSQYYKEDIKEFVSNYICVVLKDYISDVVSEFGEDFYSVFKEKVKARMLSINSYDIFQHKDSYHNCNSKAVDIMNEVFSDNNFKEEFKNVSKTKMLDKVDNLEYDDFMDMFKYGIIDLLKDTFNEKKKVGV